jgi:hypothetical protein
MFPRLQVPAVLPYIVVVIRGDGELEFIVFFVGNEWIFPGMTHSVKQRIFIFCSIEGLY